MAARSTDPEGRPIVWDGESWNPIPPIEDKRVYVEIKAAKGADGRWRGYMYAPEGKTGEDEGIPDADNATFGSFDSLCDLLTSIGNR